MSRLTVERVTAPDDVTAALAVRREVFVVEQDVPVDLEQDERDATADHFLVRVEDQPVGAGRLVVEPPGFEGVDPGLGEVAHLGRLAVSLEVRGTGLGAVLVRAIEARARERGLLVMYLGAQTHAVAFYERLGYGAHGAVFDDAGIPHRHMTRLL
ncbi:MAG TPA: GNAT family N-acetyltransferase [Actinomycetes bacterium]